MRIVYVDGGKGGILKTGTAQLLAAWYVRNGVRWAGGDTDQENKIFASVYPDRVKPFDVYDVDAGRLRGEGVNALVDDIDRARAEGYEIYLIDMGAGQANVIRGALGETGMLEAVKAGEIKLSVVFVVVNTDASLSTLLTGLERSFTEVPVEWVVAKNEYKGPLDDVLQDPALKSRLAHRKAQMIRIPLVPPDSSQVSVVTKWENSGTSLAEFADRGGSFSERGRLKMWMGVVHRDFDGISDVLRDQISPKNGVGKKTASAGKV